MTPTTVHSQSHRVLGEILLSSLTSVQIEVQLEPNLLGDSPRADILLLRREGDAWSEAQRARLPDGVRDNAAGHVLVEFKYSESVNEPALTQAVAYDHFYRQGQKLLEEQVMTVLLSARTPRKDGLEKWGYKEVQKGVFRSPLPLLRRVWLLVLNRLEAQPHNAFVKLFASRAQEREAAFAALEASTIDESSSLQTYLFGLKTTMESKGRHEMIEGLTPEKIMELGEKVRGFVLETIRPEDVSERLRQRILETASPAERLSGLDAQERLSGLDAQERLSGLDAQERLSGLDAQERLSGLDAQERLAGMTAAERKALLRLLQDELDAGAGGESDRNGER